MARADAIRNDCLRIESKISRIIDQRRLLMKKLDEFRKAGEDIYGKLHMATYPVSITYIKEEGEIPKGTFRPSKGSKKLSLCQAITLSRKWDMHVAMTADDNFCTPATAFHGWADISKEDVIESQVRQGWHKDRQAEERRIEGAWVLLRSKGSTVEGLSRLCLISAERREDGS